MQLNEQEVRVMLLDTTGSTGASSNVTQQPGAVYRAPHMFTPIIMPDRHSVTDSLDRDKLNFTEVFFVLPVTILGFTTGSVGAGTYFTPVSAGIYKIDFQITLQLASAN